MQDRIRAIAIVTTLHSLFMKVQRQGPSLRPTGIRRFFRYATSPDMFRIERDLKLTSHLEYFEALVVSHTVEQSIRDRIHEMIVRGMARHDVIKRGRNSIPAGQLEVVFDIVEHNGSSVYGFQILRNP